jgi:hypothetical protein
MFDFIHRRSVIMLSKGTRGGTHMSVCEIYSQGVQDPGVNPITRQALIYLTASLSGCFAQGERDQPLHCRNHALLLPHVSCRCTLPVQKHAGKVIFSCYCQNNGPQASFASTEKCFLKQS